MELLKSYIIDRRRYLLAWPAAAAVIAFVFFLYDLPPEAPAYALLLSGTVLLLFFILPDFVFYYRKARQLQALRRSLSFLPEPPAPEGPLPERELEEMLGDLCRKLREAETAHTKKQDDMMQYYTLWVHQIKTPLAAMRLVLSQSAREEGLSRESGEILTQELFKVERYVEMVLGYLRLDSMSSDLRLERCRVYDIVRQAVKKFAPQFIYKKLSLDFSPFDDQVITDEKWLVFVLEQLLSNALKYTHAGGVSIFMEPGEVLVIRDTGVGIGAEDLPRIFERGFTGCNGRQDKTSTGLGLYLSKEILDRLQTPIRISSEPGKGTEARLLLHRDSMPVY